MKIRFISSNKYKIEEIQGIMSGYGVDVIPVGMKIDEIQTDDVRRLVKDKCIKAYQNIGRGLFVEHTSLHISSLNGFPAGLTQIFWDTIGAEIFAQKFGVGDDVGVTARTTIGYCDGRTVDFFEGEVKGSIASEPRGNRDFQWDCVFVPDGEAKTFAELGVKRKNEISMRGIALKSFFEKLTDSGA